MAKPVLNKRYELGDEVGKGGMAITYRARDMLLNRTVAVKLMREQLSSDADFVERFRREAQSAANLSHENIASVYDTGADNGRHYIVMEFVEGENLERHLRREGPLDPVAAIDIALQVVAALEAAHRRGVVHRDVKPHNVLIDAEGRVKVTDFGIAKAITASADTETGTIIGSVHYFSPEQARGDPVGPQSDLYSLGIVLFEAITGRRPFEGDNPVAVAHKQIYDQPPLPSECRPDLPEELESIVVKLLEKSLARRYATTADVQADLEDVRDRLVNRRRRMRRSGAATRRRRLRRSLAWAAAVLAVSALAVAAYLFAGAQRQPPQIAVPDLSGLDPTSAQRLLAETGLRYRVAPDGIYTNVQAGLIARQSPPAPTRVTRDAAITVWLSLGPRYAKVPDVARMSPEQAEKRLKQAGLEVGQTLEQYDDRIPEGYVVATEPGAGEQVGRRTQVALVVSKGAPPSPWEPSPGTGAGTSEATVAYTVPADVGADEAQVRVEVVDDRGKRVLYDAPHAAGDQLPTLKVRYTGRAIVRVLINEKERWSRVFGEEEPREPASPGAT